jgi:hypothetical protein
MGMEGEMNPDEKGHKFQNVYYRRRTDPKPLKLPREGFGLKFWHVMAAVALIAALVLAI